MSETTTVQIGDRTFVLDREKAEEAFASKRVINGKETMFFNILPLKYQWAYDLYKTMKNQSHFYGTIVSGCATIHNMVKKHDTRSQVNMEKAVIAIWDAQRLHPLILGVQIEACAVLKIFALDRECDGPRPKERPPPAICSLCLAAINHCLREPSRYGAV